MTFDWTHYRLLAQELVAGVVLKNQPPIQEARLRAAISRAYYAAYCIARNYILVIENLSRIPKNESTHQWVIQKYYRPHDRVWFGIYTTLRRLRDRRELADYSDVIQKSEQELKAYA